MTVGSFLVPQYYDSYTLPMSTHGCVQNTTDHMVTEVSATTEVDSITISSISYQDRWATVGEKILFYPTEGWHGLVSLICNVTPRELHQWAHQHDELHQWSLILGVYNSLYSRGQPMYPCCSSLSWPSLSIHSEHGKRWKSRYWLSPNTIFYIELNFMVRRWLDVLGIQTDCTEYHILPNNHLSIIAP